MRRSEAGFTYLLVLGALALIGGLVAWVGSTARETARFVARYREEMGSLSAARSGLRSAMDRLLEDDPAVDHPEEPWARPLLGSWEGSVFRVTVADEGSLLPFTATPDSVLVELPGASGQAVAQFLDWQDPDHTPRPLGAEEEEYRAEGLEYGPANRPFGFHGELALLPAAGGQVPPWARWLTPFARVNVNTTSALGFYWLLVKAGVEPRQARELAGFLPGVLQTGGPVSSFQELKARLPGIPPQPAENATLVYEGTINVNTAPEPVLVALSRAAGLDAAAARDLAAARRWTRFRSPTDLRVVQHPEVHQGRTVPFPHGPAGGPAPVRPGRGGPADAVAHLPLGDLHPHRRGVARRRPGRSSARGTDPRRGAPGASGRRRGPERGTPGAGLGGTLPAGHRPGQGGGGSSVSRFASPPVVVELQGDTVAFLRPDAPPGQGAWVSPRAPLEAAAGPALGACRAWLARHRPPSRRAILLLPRSEVVCRVRRMPRLPPRELCRAVALDVAAEVEGLPAPGGDGGGGWYYSFLVHQVHEVQGTPGAGAACTLTWTAFPRGQVEGWRRLFGKLGLQLAAAYVAPLADLWGNPAPTTAAAGPGAGEALSVRLLHYPGGRVVATLSEGPLVVGIREDPGSQGSLPGEADGGGRAVEHLAAACGLALAAQDTGGESWPTAPARGALALWARHGRRVTAGYGAPGALLPLGPSAGPGRAGRLPAAAVAAALLAALVGIPFLRAWHQRLGVEIAAAEEALARAEARLQPGAADSQAAADTAARARLAARVGLASRWREEARGPLELWAALDRALPPGTALTHLTWEAGRLRRIEGTAPDTSAVLKGLESAAALVGGGVRLAGPLTPASGEPPGDRAAAGGAGVPPPAAPRERFAVEVVEGEGESDARSADPGTGL